MKTLKLIVILIAVLLPLRALAQIQSIETSVMDQKVNEPGFILGNDTTFQGTLFAGWFDTVYMQKFGESEPFEVDIEGSWDIYQNGPWAISSYAGIFLLNTSAAPTTGNFHAAREVGITTIYNTKNNGPQMGLYAAKFSSDITLGQKGLLFKFFICDQQKKNDQVAVGNFNYGWKALIAYNEEYFLDDNGISHIQGQAWIKYRATNEITLTGHADKQISLMSQFDSPAWFGLSISYNF